MSHTQVSDVQGPEVAAAGNWNEDWAYIYEVYPGGDFDILWIYKSKEPGIWLVRSRGGKIKRVGSSLRKLFNDVAKCPTRLVSSFSLENAKVIDVKSGTCPMVSLDMDRKYSLNLASSEGILRLKVGTKNKDSKSNFYTSALFYPKENVMKIDVAPDGAVTTVVSCDSYMSCNDTLLSMSDNMALLGQAEDVDIVSV